MIVAPIRDMSELESIVAAQAREPNNGLIGMPDAFLDDHRADFTSLAARYRVPAIYPFRQYAYAAAAGFVASDADAVFARHQSLYLRLAPVCSRPI